MCWHLICVSTAQRKHEPTAKQEFAGCAHSLRYISDVMSCNFNRPLNFLECRHDKRGFRDATLHFTLILSQSRSPSGSEHKPLLSCRFVMNSHTLLAKVASYKDLVGHGGSENMTFKSCFVEQSSRAHVAVLSLHVPCRIRLIEHGLNWINHILQAGAKCMLNRLEYEVAKYLVL